MNIRLWGRLFCFQFITLLGFTLIVSAVFIWGYQLVTLQEIMAMHFWSIPVYIIMLALILTMSLIFATIFTVSLSGPFEEIRARINWLLLRKYNHPIFKQEKFLGNWYDSQTQIVRDINRLREHIVQLSSDLQEYTAAPIFVGEETKEEIIEKERQRIARELHDSVSQQLFAAMMMISAISEVAESQASPISKQIKQIEGVINNAQTEMRALLLHLRPVDLADQKLEEGIKHLLTELESKVPMEIKWSLEPTELDSGIEDHLFRIVQEAISNTMRHAQASKLEIYLDQDINSVNLKIVDDGKGFIVKEGLQKGNYGLRNMEDRVKSLGGTYKLVSYPDKGTVIDIKIPVKIKEK